MQSLAGRYRKLLQSNHTDAKTFPISLLGKQAPATEGQTGTWWPVGWGEITATQCPRKPASNMATSAPGDRPPTWPPSPSAPGEEASNMAATSAPGRPASTWPLLCLLGVRVCLPRWRLPAGGIWARLRPADTWIFMATLRPSSSCARCTCPMEAAAKGRSSNQASRLRQSGPSSLFSTPCMEKGEQQGQCQPSPPLAPPHLRFGPPTFP